MSPYRTRFSDKIPKKSVFYSINYEFIDGSTGVIEQGCLQKESAFCCIHTKYPVQIGVCLKKEKTCAFLDAAFDL